MGQIVILPQLNRREATGTEDIRGGDIRDKVGPRDATNMVCDHSLPQRACEES